jgi:hypothetical protein
MYSSEWERKRERQEEEDVRLTQRARQLDGRESSMAHEEELLRQQTSRADDRDTKNRERDESSIAREAANKDREQRTTDTLNAALKQQSEAEAHQKRNEEESRILADRIQQFLSEKLKTEQRLKTREDNVRVAEEKVETREHAVTAREGVCTSREQATAEEKAKVESTRNMVEEMTRFNQTKEKDMKAECIRLDAARVELQRVRDNMGEEEKKFEAAKAQLVADQLACSMDRKQLVEWRAKLDLQHVELEGRDHTITARETTAVSREKAVTMREHDVEAKHKQQVDEDSKLKGRELDCDKREHELQLEIRQLRHDRVWSFIHALHLCHSIV